MSTVFVTTPSGFLEDSQPPDAIDVDNEEEISSTKALYTPSPTSTSDRCRRKGSSRTREDMMNKMWRKRKQLQ